MSKTSRTPAGVPRIFSFTIHTPEFRNLPIPNTEDAKIGDCFVKVTDLPERLDDFMEVNPRVPKRTQKGVLSGPVIKGILETLRERPEDMSIKNQGIYLLVESAKFEKKGGGVGELAIQLNDCTRHGIVNGGHTYAAIREAINTAAATELLDEAFVRLHILQGIQTEKVSEIAEGLNRSKQVDDPSLANLKGLFTDIARVMKGQPGAHAIAYNQGDSGEVYISEVLVYLQFFNGERFNESRHPHQLYRRQSDGLKFFEHDAKLKDRGELAATDLLVSHLPEILRLADCIRFATPKAAKANGFEFGRMKVSGNKRAGSGNVKQPLPFIDQLGTHRVPKGWLFPMLAGFRANVRWNLSEGLFEWIVPPEKLLKAVIGELVNVCVSEHRDNNLPPEAVGKRESSYRQCYDKIVIHLARKGLLTA